MIKKRGFTLIETVIAVALFTMVAISAYGSFRSGFLAYQRIESQLGKEHEFKMLANELNRELRNAIEYAPIAFSGKSDSIRFPCRLWRYSDNQLQENLYDVSYQFRDGQLERSELKLKRKFGDRSEPLKESLLPFESCRFQYAYKKHNDGIEWRNEWGKSPYLGLPRAIRLIVKNRSLRQKAEEKIIDILIPHGILGEIR